MENTVTDWQGFLYIAFFQLLFHLPTIAVYIVGIVVAFIKSKKYPKISFLSGAGFAILLILSVLSALVSILAPYLYSQKYNTQSIGYIVAAVGFIMTLMTAVASVLLLRAVWKDRS